MTGNVLKMTVLSKSTNESFVRVAVAAFVSQLDPTVEEIGDIKTAVSEAVTNCIVHAYKNDSGNIYISVLLKENRTVVIKVRDKGCGIPDIAQAMTPTFTTGGEERSGLGFSVMECFCDKLKVTSNLGKGTTVTLTKQLSRNDG